MKCIVTRVFYNTSWQTCYMYVCHDVYCNEYVSACLLLSVEKCVQQSIKYFKRTYEK